MITKSKIHEIENAPVKDRDGASVGKVAQVFPSTEDGSAALVSVATGLLGGHTVLVPVEDATFDGTDLHAVIHGRIAVTPVQLELVHRPSLDSLKSALA